MFVPPPLSSACHLPLQYWCFPSCHSHRDEQSRLAGGREQSGFVLTAKSWWPAWFCFNLTDWVGEREWTVEPVKTLGRNVGLCTALCLYTRRVYVTLLRKLYFLGRHTTSLTWMAYTASWMTFSFNTLFIHLLNLSHLATVWQFSFAEQLKHVVL